MKSTVQVAKLLQLLKYLQKKKKKKKEDVCLTNFVRVRVTLARRNSRAKFSSKF